MSHILIKGELSIFGTGLIVYLIHVLVKFLLILIMQRFESGLLSGWLTDRNEMNMQNYPQNFQDRINMSDDLINAISLLSENQLNMINEKLDDDVLIQKAFEYFGQGVLFDDFSDVETNQPRRPSDDRVHMMDSIHFGYPRWHVFCRSASFIDLDQDIWLKIDRLIGLAYALHMRDLAQMVPIRRIQNDPI